jgi:hypothetical protein
VPLEIGPAVDGWGEFARPAAGDVDDAATPGVDPVDRRTVLGAVEGRHGELRRLDVGEDPNRPGADARDHETILELEVLIRDWARGLD